jgi:hypothetical protein
MGKTLARKGDSAAALEYYHLGAQIGRALVTGNPTDNYNRSGLIRAYAGEATAQADLAQSGEHSGAAGSPAQIVLLAAARPGKLSCIGEHRTLSRTPHAHEYCGAPNGTFRYAHLFPWCPTNLEMPASGA